MNGVIARIVVDRETGKRKGFGFIKMEDATEVFFHASGLIRETARFEDINEGDQVECIVVDGVKGPRAENVRVLA